MKSAMSRPMTFIVARPRSLITFRSCAAVSRLIRKAAAISTTANSTRLYGTRSRTDSLNTARATARDGREVHSCEVVARGGGGDVLDEERLEGVAYRIERQHLRPGGRQLAQHRVGRIGRQFDGVAAASSATR